MISGAIATTDTRAERLGNRHFFRAPVCPECVLADVVCSCLTLRPGADILCSLAPPQDEGQRNAKWVSGRVGKKRISASLTLFIAVWSSKVTARVNLGTSWLVQQTNRDSGRSLNRVIVSLQFLSLINEKARWLFHSFPNSQNLLAWRIAHSSPIRILSLVDQCLPFPFSFFSITSQLN